MVPLAPDRGLEPATAGRGRSDHLRPRPRRGRRPQARLADGGGAAELPPSQRSRGAGSDGDHCLDRSDQHGGSQEQRRRHHLRALASDGSPRRPRAVPTGGRRRDRAQDLQPDVGRDGPQLPRRGRANHGARHDHPGPPPRHLRKLESRRPGRPRTRRPGPTGPIVELELRGCGPGNRHPDHREHPSRRGGAPRRPLSEHRWPPPRHHRARSRRRRPRQRPGSPHRRGRLAHLCSPRT